jgi:hypothetical protein
MPRTSMTDSGTAQDLLSVPQNSRRFNAQIDLAVTPCEFNSVVPNQSQEILMSSLLRSSVIETLMLLLFMVWTVAFSASLFHSTPGSLESRAESQTHVVHELRHS